MLVGHGNPVRDAEPKCNVCKFDHKKRPEGWYTWRLLRHPSQEDPLKDRLQPVDSAKPPFDSANFLAKVGGGRTIIKYRTGQKIFAQGEPADAIFYVQKGRV